MKIFDKKNFSLEENVRNFAVLVLPGSSLIICGFHFIVFFSFFGHFFPFQCDDKIISSKKYNQFLKKIFSKFWRRKWQIIFSTSKNVCLQNHVVFWYYSILIFFLQKMLNFRKNRKLERLRISKRKKLKTFEEFSKIERNSFQKNFEYLERKNKNSKKNTKFSKEK